jgi:hypothetical protein
LIEVACLEGFKGLEVSGGLDLLNSNRKEVLVIVVDVVKILVSKSRGTASFILVPSGRSAAILKVAFSAMKDAFQRTLSSMELHACCL